MKKVLKILAIAALLVPATFAGYIWWKLQPQVQPLRLPAHLVGIDTAAGLALLDSADAVADYPELEAAFRSQELISFCGVASAVTVLNAMGRKATQSTFFTEEAKQVRSRIQVSLGGMSLADLAGLLSAHQIHAELTHGDAITLDSFRSVITSNLSTDGDFLLVNYQREILGQGRVGHISPLAAYDSASDRVLIMDTASYKYPYTWVQVDTLFAAMQEVDTASGVARGFIEVGSNGGHQY